MEALGRLAAGDLPWEDGPRARVLGAAADQLVAGPLAAHLLDAVWRAAAQALRMPARPFPAESTVAALRCMQHVATHDTRRVSPELVDLVTRTVLLPSCVATSPPTRAEIASCEAGLSALCAFTSSAAQRAGGLLCLEPTLLLALVRGTCIPLCLAAAPESSSSLNSSDVAGAVSSCPDPRLPSLVELLKALHEQLGGGGRYGSPSAAAPGDNDANARTLCLLCESLIRACEAEAGRRTPHFLLKNHLWRLLVRTATVPLLLREVAAAARGGGRGGSAERAHDPDHPAAVRSDCSGVQDGYARDDARQISATALGDLPVRLFRCATCRLVAQIDAAVDAGEAGNGAATGGQSGGAAPGGSAGAGGDSATCAERMRVALFGLIQMRNLCGGYRDWLASEALHGDEAAREAGSVLARAGRRLMVRIAGGPGGRVQEWLKLLAKLDEVISVLLEDGAAPGTINMVEGGLGVALASRQEGEAARAPATRPVREEVGSRLLRGWAAMAMVACDAAEAASECGCAPAASSTMNGAAFVPASSSVSPLDAALIPPISEPGEWLWLLLVALRASSRVPSEAAHQVAAAAVLPAALKLLPHSYAAVMGPSARAAVAAATAPSVVPAAPGTDAAGCGSPSVLVLISTLVCGYACAAPAAVRSLLLSSLLGGALAAHPVPRLVAREAMARLVAGIAPGYLMPTLQPLLDLAKGLVAIGLPAARERAHTVELLAALVPHLPRPSLSCFLCALGEPLDPQRMVATMRDEAAVVASTGTCAAASSRAGPAGTSRWTESSRSTETGGPPAGDADGHVMRSESGTRLLLSLYFLAELPPAVGRRSAVSSPAPSGPVAEGGAGNDLLPASLGCPASSLAEALAGAGGSSWVASLAHVSATAPPPFAGLMLIGAASLVALLPPSVRPEYAQCARSRSASPLSLGPVAMPDEASLFGSTTRENAAATLSNELLAALASGGPLAAAAAEAAAVAALQLRTPTIEAIASAVDTFPLCGHNDRGAGADRSVGGGIGRGCLLVVSLLRRPLSATAYNHVARLILRLASTTAHAAAHAGFDNAPDPADQAAVSTCRNFMSRASLNRGERCRPFGSWLGVHEAARAASEFTTTANVEALGRMIEALRSQHITPPSLETRADMDYPAQVEADHGLSLAAPLLEFLERVDAQPDANTCAQVAREMALAVETGRRVFQARATSPAESVPAQFGSPFKLIAARMGGKRIDGDAHVRADDSQAPENTPRIPLHPLLPGAGPQPLARVALEPPAKRARLTAGLESGLGMLSSGLAAVGKAAAVASQAERAELQARLRAHETELHRVVERLETTVVGGIGR